MSKVIQLFSTVLLLVGAPALAGEVWPDFRGPTGQGHSDATGLPANWSETQNVTWKTPIHGKAWSTPVIWGEQVWMSTATPDGKKMYVICVDRNTGKVLVDRLLFENAKPDPLGNDQNGYGSPSPVIDAGRVYIHFGSYGTAAIDTKTFKTLWQRRDLPCNHWRGPASSPVLYQNLLILTFDGADYQYLAALDKQSGQTVWRTPRSTDFNDLDASGKPAAGGDYRKAFNTPLLVNVKGQVQLISPGAKAAFAYEPLTGKEIWTLRYKQQASASRTVFADGIAYINAGYGHADIYAVRADGSGDVTDTHVIWRTGRGTPQQPSPLVLDGLFYMVADNGVLSCLDAKTGEVFYAERLDGNFSSSLLYADGRIYACNREGATFVIQPGRQFKLIATNQLDDGMRASPAVAGKAMFLRTYTHLYRIEK